MANDHLYKLLYRVEGKPEGVSAEEVAVKAKKGFGACDAMLLASLIYPEDGSFSCLFIGVDGRKGLDAELDDHEWFKVWTMLANRLAASETLSPGQKALCHEVFEIIAAPMRAARAAETESDPTT